MPQSSSSVVSVAQARRPPSCSCSSLRQMRMPSTLSVAEDLDGRDQEAQHDPAPPALRLEPGVAGQDLDVLARGRAGRLALEPGAAERVDVHVAGVHEHVGVGHLAELEQLGVGERRLGRAAPAEHDDLLDGAAGEHVERVVGDVGLGQLVAGQREHAGDVGRDVAVAHHHRALAGEVEHAVAEVRVAVVPGHELGGGPAAGKVLAGNAHAAVGLGADRVDHRVVAGVQVGVGDVAAVLDVAVEAELGVRRGLLVDAADRLDVGVVGRDSAAHEPPGGGQAVVDVHLDVQVGMRLALEQMTGRVEAGRPRSDDRDAQRLLRCSGRSHRTDQSRSGSSCGEPPRRTPLPPRPA